MDNKSFLKLRKKPGKNKTLAALVIAALFCGLAPVAKAGVPDWLRAAAQVPLPQYANDVKAVKVFADQATTVNSSGEIKTRYRIAYKILRPEGRDQGRVRVGFNNETQVTYLKAWSLTADGQEYEVKEKDSVERSLGSPGELYGDARAKVLTIPAADPGNVVGYEYEQRQRPDLLQDVWYFQDDIPVKHSRFELELPPGWEFSTFWLNHAEVKPQQAGENRWVWELNDLDAVEEEPSMPDWAAVAGRMAVSYLSNGHGVKGNRAGTWAEIGRWYGSLAQGRRDVSPEIRQKVAELTVGSRTPLEKIDALATFVQQQIRYVAIEIGIGGLQPHAAQEIFKVRYGDCKDKATLLSSMLQAAGIKSYYMLINSARGVAQPELPSAYSFNHVILAIQVPPDVPVQGLYASYEDKQLGRILLFDPTNTMTKLGSLPYYLQNSYGLLVTDDGGEIVSLPLLPPAVNRLLRSATFRLAPSGAIAGAVKEIRWGAPGAERRSQLKFQSDSERQKSLERFLSSFVGGLILQDSKIDNLDNNNENLIVSYSFLAKDYSKQAGPLVLVRPCVLGEKAVNLDQEKGKTRKFPVEFRSTTLETDMYDIVLPAGYAVDELPAAVNIQSPFGRYVTKIEASGNVVKYQRQFQIDSVLVPADRVDELKKFFGLVQADERSSVVLKQVATSQPDSLAAPK